MTRFGIPTLGWLTSLLLCLITFYIFWTFRYYGPESTLHRYHAAAAEIDRIEGESLSYPNFDSKRSADLWRFTVGLMAQGHTRYALVHRTQEPKVATFIVQYDPPGPIDPALVWRVAKVNGVWKIHANETTAAMQRFSGLYFFEYGR